jgi:hypothetical protein
MKSVLQILASNDPEEIASLPLLFRERDFDAIATFSDIWAWLLKHHRRVSDGELPSVLTYFKIAPLDSELMTEQGFGELTQLLEDGRFAQNSAFALWLNRLAFASAQMTVMRGPVAQRLTSILFQYASGERPSAWAKLYFRMLLFFPIDAAALRAFQGQLEEIVRTNPDGDVQWAVGEILKKCQKVGTTP